MYLIVVDVTSLLVTLYTNKLMLTNKKNANIFIGVLSYTMPVNARIRSGTILDAFLRRFFLQKIGLHYAV